MIIINLVGYTNNHCSAVTNVEKAKIEDTYLTGVRITLNIFINSFDPEFIFEINSTLLHELVHTYEHYNLLLGNKFRPHYWSIGSINKQLHDTYKNPDVQNILNLLYKSLRHEIASQLQQYYDYKKNDKEYNHIFDIINDLKNFTVTNINDKFIYELNQVRQHIYNSIKIYATNKYYLKDLDKSLWKNKIDKDNVSDFIIELRSLFLKGVKYIEKKIKLINSKLTEIRYDDYANTLTEQVYRTDGNYFRKFPVLFF
jgi:hypothetical protein